MLVQPCINPEQRANQSEWNRFHPEQLQSGLDETDLHQVGRVSRPQADCNRL